MEGIIDSGCKTAWMSEFVPRNGEITYDYCWIQAGENTAIRAPFSLERHG
jgi:hypothetical protein